MQSRSSSPSLSTAHDELENIAPGSRRRSRRSMRTYKRLASRLATFLTVTTLSCHQIGINNNVVAYQVRPASDQRGWSLPSSLSEPEPYETGFVDRYGDGSLRMRGRTRINEGGQARTPGIHGDFAPGVKYNPENETLSFLPGLSRTNQVLRFEHEGVLPRQICPSMVGPRADGAYYCIDENHGFCDKRSGMCHCYEGYEGEDCSACKTTHFPDPSDNSTCIPKVLCPSDCSGAGTCDLSTGVCACKPHRTGTDCSVPRCHVSAGGELCTTCDAISGACTECAKLHYLAEDGTCQPCSDFDPRCARCTAQDGCLACGDPILLSIRRSGRRYTDPVLPFDEIARELAISLPFGTQDPRAFDEAEPFSKIDEATGLADYSVDCIQGPSTAAWTCSPASQSHVQCGHHGTLSFSSPTYAVLESAHYLEITVQRTGGGYGHVAVDYELRYGTAGPEDVSPTAAYTSLQRLDFLPGVVSLTFHISIHDDAVLEDDEHFDLLLLNPRSIDDPSIPVSLGPQHQAQVTIHDDDFWYADAQSSILYHPTWVTQAGDSFSFAVFLRTSTGLALEDALPSSVKLVAQITDSVPAKPGTPMLECAHLAADEYICTHPVGPILEYHTIATLAKAGGLVAEFYDVPFIESADPFLRRVDTVLDFIWGHGPIALTARDYVTVRWHGAIALPVSATSTAVQLRVMANDRARVTLDGIVVLDDWDHGPLGTAATVTVELIQGNLHHIQVDYRELDGSAHLQLLWSIDGATFEVIPPSALYQLLPLPDMNTTILTADVDAASTFATGSCLETSIAGDPCVFFIHPRDAYTNGDPNITQDVFFEATVTLETASMPGNTLLPGNSVVLGTINATEDVPPTLQVVIDPIAAGTHILEITVGNVHIAGSPFSLQVEPTHPHGPSFDISGSGIDTAPVSTHVVGDLKSVYLVLRDPYGNRIEEDLSALISIQVVHASVPGEVVTADISYLGSSEYLATYTVTRADQVNVQATIGCNQFGASVPCEHIAASPYALTFMHAASSAGRTFASGAGTAGATSGIEASVIVHLRDEFGNKVDTTPEAAASLSLRLVFDDGAFEDFVGVCVHQAEDLFSCPYTPARAEEQASLFIYLGGVAINEANAYTVDVSDGSCDAAQSFSSGVGNAYAVAGDITYFTVESHDAAGNPRVGPCADGITFRTDHAFYVDTTPPADGEPGIYTLSYNATLAGFASIAVYMVDATDTPIGTIMDSPLNVTVGPNSVEHARAIIRGAGLTQGVAGALHPVSIQAVDAFGNNLTQNGDVKFRVTHVEEGIEFMAGDLDQGLYNGSYVPFVAQNGTLQISVTQPGGIDAAYYRTRFFGSEPVEKVEQSLAFVWDDYASWDEDPLLENSAAWGARMFGLLKAPAQGAVPSAEEYDLRTAYLENGMVRLGFRLRIDGGGARLWVNGKLLVDQWPEADVGITAWAQLPSQVPALAFLPIQLDFARDSSHPTAALSLEWATFDRAGQLASTPEQVPDEALYRWREISTFYPTTVPAAAYPEASYVVDWTPLENLVAGIETIFEVQVTDAFGNDVFTHDDLVQVYGWSVPDLRGVDDGLDPDGMLVSASIVADPEERGGRFQITLTPTASGEFIVFIAVNTPEMHADLGRSELLEQLRLYQVADAPRRLSVRPGAISAVECSVSGSEVSANIAGEQGVFYVQVRDVSGNRREDENDIQAITVHEDARWEGNVTYQSHGLFQVKYTMLSAGDWNITIELSDGSSIAPFEIVVSPAEAFAATTSTSVVGDAAALTSPLQISITARDAFGNVLDRGGDHFVLHAELQDAFTPQLVLGETPANDLRPFRFGAPWVDFLQSTVDHTNGTYTMTLDFGTLEGSFLLHVELASGTGLLGSFFASPAAQEGELALASDVLVQNAGSLQTIAATRAHYAGYVWVEHTANYSFALATDAEVGNDLEDGDHSQEQVISVGYVPLTQNESFRLRGDRVYPLAIKTWAQPPFRLHLEWETALGADAAAAPPEQELAGHAQVTKYSQTFILSSDLSGQLGEGDKVRVRDEVFTVTAFDETRQILHVDLPYGGESSAAERIYRRVRRSSIPNENLYPRASPVSQSPLALTLQTP